MPSEAYELTVSGILSGQFVQNVMHVNIDNTASSAPYLVAQTLLETLDATVGFFSAWCDALPTDYRITSVRARRVLATGGPTAIMLGSVLVEDTGQRSGSIQAAQVNPVIVLITTLRPNRPGKIFLPGVSVTDLADMTYTSGVLAVYETLKDLIVAGFLLDTLTYNCSFGIYRRAIGASDDITAGRVSPLIGTQRKRLRPV